MSPSSQVREKKLLVGGKVVRSRIICPYRTDAYRVEKSPWSVFMEKGMRCFLRPICGSMIHDAGIPVSFHMHYIFSITNLKLIRGSLQPACKDWTTRTDRLKQNELVVFSRI